MAPSPFHIIRKSSLLEDGMLASYSVICTDAKKKKKKFKRSGWNDRENYSLSISCVDYACFIIKNMGTIVCSKNVQGIPNLSK